MLAILNRIREKNRISILVVFTLTTLLSIMLVAFRVHYTSKVTFVFLVWNTILALIPYFISTLLVVYHHRIKSPLILLIPIAVWLCFFPNAPYILTDLFHLRQRPNVPYWFDLALILFFAWNGLMLGYASLADIHSILNERFNRLIGWIATLGFLVLGGFGIYLGRYLRWNSWDVISSPSGLIEDISSRIVNPTDYPHTYGVTIIFSLFLILGYVLLQQFSQVYRVAPDNERVSS
jgi:uncharacterized membrane protein